MNEQDRNFILGITDNANEDVDAYDDEQFQNELRELWEVGKVITTASELFEGDRVIVLFAKHLRDETEVEHMLGEIERGRIYLDKPAGLIISLGNIDPANVRRLGR